MFRPFIKNYFVSSPPLAEDEQVHRPYQSFTTTIISNRAFNVPTQVEHQYPVRVATVRRDATPDDQSRL